MSNFWKRLFTRKSTEVGRKLEKKSKENPKEKSPYLYPYKIDIMNKALIYNLSNHEGYGYIRKVVVNSEGKPWWKDVTLDEVTTLFLDNISTEEKFKAWVKSEKEKYNKSYKAWLDSGSEEAAIAKIKLKIEEINELNKRRI